MPTKDQNAPRTPSGQKSRAIPGATRGGRKPRADVAATAILHFRVTPGEEEAIRAAASAAGLDVTAWLRGAVADALTRADHARQYVAQLEAVGGMPGATD